MTEADNGPVRDQFTFCSKMIQNNLIRYNFATALFFTFIDRFYSKFNNYLAFLTSLIVKHINTTEQELKTEKSIEL